MRADAANYLRPPRWPAGTPLAGEQLDRPGYYVGGEVAVQVDLDAMEWNEATQTYARPSPAVVVVTDLEHFMYYAVEAVEDQHGRARLLSVSKWVALEELRWEELPLRYADEPPLRSEAWLARIAIECAQGVSRVAESDEDVMLRRIAETVTRCERDGVSSADVLVNTEHVSRRSVSRLVARAVAAGFLAPRGPGRPSRSLPTPGGFDA